MASPAGSKFSAAAASIDDDATGCADLPRGGTRDLAPSRRATRSTGAQAAATPRARVPRLRALRPKPRRAALGLESPGRRAASALAPLVLRSRRRQGPRLARIRRDRERARRRRDRRRRRWSALRRRRSPGVDDDAACPGAAGANPRQGGTTAHDERPPARRASETGAGVRCAPGRGSAAARDAGGRALRHAEDRPSPKRPDPRAPEAEAGRSRSGGDGEPAATAAGAGRPSRAAAAADRSAAALGPTYEGPAVAAGAAAARPAPTAAAATASASVGVTHEARLGRLAQR
jgi:hypothetical protein